jgi:hypothetical protein
MRRTILGLSCLTLLAALPARADVILRTLSQQYDAARVEQVHLDFPVGSLEVEGVPGGQVRLEIRLECDSERSRCAEAAKHVRLADPGSSGNLHVRFEGWPKTSLKGLKARVHAQVPRDLPLHAELGVGELDIQRGRADWKAEVGVGEAKISHEQGDLDVDVGVGEVRIHMPETAVASVSADTGMGEASLRTGTKRYQGTGFLGHEVRWKQGRGGARIQADCGVGEITVQLE